MRAPNLSEAARVTRRLLNQYGPARLLRVEELAPGIFRGMLAGGAQALAVIREDGRIAVREARAVGIKNPPGAFRRRGGRQGVYHENNCIIPWERVFDKGEFA